MPIRNRIRDLPPCSVMPQQITLQSAPIKVIGSIKLTTCRYGAFYISIRPYSVTTELYLHVAMKVHKSYYRYSLSTVINLKYEDFLI
jgi:hypothetical protein